MKKISTCLISVFDKSNLVPIIKKLAELEVEIFSTGGTEKFINDLGVQVKSIEKLTNYPSILGGRVKTLHPKVFGGILQRRENIEDQREVMEYAIPSFDLVIVDLYPFAEVVRKNQSHNKIIEKIDIGGISLIRAAAKNYNDVVCIPSIADYTKLLDILEEKKGVFEPSDKLYFASRAFSVSHQYDFEIFKYLSGNKEVFLPFANTISKKLRYGENPHQSASFYGNFDNVFEKLNGKELSYNNLLDIDSAVSLIKEFWDNDPTFAILKHNNACGIAMAKTIKKAYKLAFKTDPISAFGGVLIANSKINKQTANEMDTLFFEVIIAPDYDQEAIDILRLKKNRIILKLKELEYPKKQIKSCLNGLLVQDYDNKTEINLDLNCVTEFQPTSREIEDLIFAVKVCKHLKSNAIVLAKNKRVVASGFGQTSRVDSLCHAIKNAKKFNLELQGAVMASDAFFPFPDCVEIAHKSGVESVIQPGGSIKDKLSIAFCNKNAISMIFTGMRHFKH